MTNLPPQDKKWLLEHGHKDIVDREGDYSQYKTEIQQLIHANDKKSEGQPVQQQPVQKTEQSRKEDKAQQRIAEVADEFYDPEYHFETDDAKTGNMHIVIDSGKHKDERYDNLQDFRESNKNPTIVPDFDLDEMEQQYYIEKEKKNKAFVSEDEEFERKNKEFNEKAKKAGIELGSAYNGMTITGLDPQTNTVTLNNSTNLSLDEIIEGKSKNDKPDYSWAKQNNWYDNLTDDNEHAKYYKDLAMKVNPERAALIAAAMDEYVGEKPQRGFITADQLKKYGDRLGLGKLSDRDLRLMWDDVHNVGGYKGFGTPYDKGGRELEDARSAFTEIINQEARNRKAKGNYFPYNDEDIESGRSSIRDILSRLDGYDLDDARGYLTSDELNKIEGIADQYHLTAEDLAQISPHLDPNRMGYRMKGWQSPEPSIFEQGLKNLNISYDNELLSKIDSMSDKEQNKLLKYMMTEMYNPGFGKNKEKLQEMLKGLK